MVFIKKEGDSIIINKKKVNVSGGNNNLFLYVDLICAKQGTTKNGSILYGALEKLAIDYQYDKIVLYSAGDSKDFWTKHEFIEEPDDKKKYYKVDDKEYHEPGVRMEKNITGIQDNSSAYVILEESGKLKEIFSKIPRIFGSEVITYCGKNNVRIGLGLEIPVEKSRKILKERTSSVAAKATVAAEAKISAVEMVAAKASVAAEAKIAAEATVAAKATVASEATVAAEASILRNDIQENRIPLILSAALQYTLF